ncbi:hypothetical protein HDU98_007063 [Podochytrium sp. JEL0797]|nr:hypothetical protein HDU98_007063 [Podochytrium sp. JEL0797]
MHFASHYVLQLCRDTKLAQLNSLAVTPSDMSYFVQHVLSTTQVSLSVVVLAFGILKKMQRKINGMTMARRDVTENEFVSLEEQSRETLARMAPRMNVKAVCVVALMMAMKSPNGCCNTFTNKTWSQVAMMSPSTLNALELDMALFLNFDLWEKESAYLEWLNTVRIAAEEYRHRSMSKTLMPQQQQPFAIPGSPVSPVTPFHTSFLLPHPVPLSRAAQQYQQYQQHHHHKFLKQSRAAAMQGPYHRDGVRRGQQQVPMLPKLQVEIPSQEYISGLLTGSSLSGSGRMMLPPLMPHQQLFMLPVVPNMGRRASYF